MIIFDTNAVHQMQPASPRADIIRKLRRSGHHRVAVPWVVLEEMAAHQAKGYPAKHQAAMAKLSKLREALPWDLESTLEPLDVERLMDYWRERYGEIFEVIETSGDAARRALSREALALPPAKQTSRHPEGARDVAIWFSILEFLEKNPEEQVCFVTANTKDFGDGVNYPYPMDEDVAKMQDRLTRLRKFDDVISTFTKTVSGEDAEDAADKLLRSLPVQSRIAQTAVEVLTSPDGFVGLQDAGLVEWHGWLDPPEVGLLSVTEVTGHKIEGDVWYTAHARWVLYGLVVDSDGASPSYTACVWETKVLFSALDGDEPLTLLEPKTPEAPDSSDPEFMEILKSLKRRFTQRLRQHISAAESVLSNQLLDIGDALRQNYAEMIAAQNAAIVKSLPDFSSLNRSFASQIVPDMSALQSRVADALPKIDVAAMLPQVDFSGFAAELGDSFDEVADDKSDGDRKEATGTDCSED